MTDTLSLDRPRARAWTLARALQNTLWDIEEGGTPHPTTLETARLLR